MGMNKGGRVPFPAQRHSHTSGFTENQVGLKLQARWYGRSIVSFGTSYMQRFSSMPSPAISMRVSLPLLQVLHRP
jgi:hypothetical protein